MLNPNVNLIFLNRSISKVIDKTFAKISILSINIYFVHLFFYFFFLEKKTLETKKISLFSEFNLYLISGTSECLCANKSSFPLYIQNYQI